MNKSGLFFYMQYGLVEVGDKNICLKAEISSLGRFCSHAAL